MLEGHMGIIPLEVQVLSCAQNTKTGYWASLCILYTKQADYSACVRGLEDPEYISRHSCGE